MIFTSDWEVALTTSILATLLMLSWIVITGYLGQISLVQVSLAGLAAFVAAKLAANVEKVSEFDLLSVTGPNLPDPLAALLGIARRGRARSHHRSAGGAHPRRPARRRHGGRGRRRSACCC